MTELKTKIEEVSPIKKKIEVEIPVHEVAKALEAEYKEIQKHAKIKGFRKGKVPQAMLERLHAVDAVQGAVERLVRDSYPKALDKENLFPISAPAVTPGEFDKEKPFTYSAIFEIRPIVELKEFAGIDLEKPEIIVTSEEVDNQLKMIQQQMTQLEPLPEGVAAETGMVMVVDFAGKVEGKEFKGSNAKDFMVELGGGNLLPQLESTLTGMKKGEKKDFELDYPADYFNKELAGKKGNYIVTVKDVKKKITPELNDEFAKDIGDFKTLADVKKDIEARILAAKEHEVKRVLTTQALAELAKRHSFEIPEAMINSEIKSMFESFVRHLASEGKKMEDIGVTPELFIEKYKGEAETRVRTFLVTDAIAEAEKVEVTEEDVESRLKEVSAQYNQPLPKVKQQYESAHMMEGLKLQIKHEKAIDLVISRAKIKVAKPKKDKK